MSKIKNKTAKVQDLKEGQTIIWGGSYRKVKKIEVVGRTVSIHIHAGIAKGIPLNHKVIVK